MTIGETITVTVRISGRAQGVGFRYWTAQTARDLGLTGSVRNKADGSVIAVFHGQRKSVEIMLKRCESGPTHAKVDRLEKNFDGIYEAGAYEEFVILR